MSQDLTKKDPFPNTGIALSGGGVRASLFALGALIYVVQTGVNREVKTIASVSGGSITSGAVSVGTDFSETSEGDFNRVAERLTADSQKQGPSSSPTRRFWTKAFLSIGLTGAALVTLLIEGLAWWELRVFDAGSIAITFLILSFFYPLLTIGPVAAVALAGRGFFQRVVFRNLFLEMASVKATDVSQPSPPMRDSSTFHVFCATELVSGRPIFMARDRTYSQSYGWGTVRTAEQN